MLAHRRPGVPDAQPGVATTRLAREVVDLGEHPAGVRQHPLARRGEDELPAGAPQQPHPERVLQAGERARHGRLRDAELGGGTGEAPGVDDRGERTEMTELDVHAFSV